MTIAEAKEIYRIDDAWRDCGYDGEPKKQCRCRFHDDRTPSFSVFDDGKRWKCFSGCGEGTVVDFIAKAKGISNEEACREIIRRAGGHREPVRQDRPKQEHVKLELPQEIPHSKELAQRAADSRGLRATSVNYAAIWLETLKFGRVKEQDCWIISDGLRKCAEARRIDGKPFPAIGTLGERKSHTLAGSRKSWPVGLRPPLLNENWLRKYVQTILLVEGMPDYLAACQLLVGRVACDVLPVAILGASQTIASEALPYFTARRVIIVGHPDKAGREAATNWGTQIQGAGGIVQPIQLKNGDLCDRVVAGATYDDINTINRN
jgi:CHC2 zinc finger